MTIQDVAQKAGVSSMTVSRVICGEGSVSPATRKRVLSVMQELGYVPSTAARAMRSKDKLRANSILCFALIFGADVKTAESFFCDVVKGAEQEAAAHGLCLLQSHWQDSFEAGGGAQIRALDGRRFAFTFDHEIDWAVLKVQPVTFDEHCDRAAGSN